MGIASSMKDLTQGIASSRHDRAKRLGQIKEGASQTREEAKGLIKDFQTSRSDAATELLQELAQDKADRKSGVKRMLGDAQASRQKEGAQLRKKLAQGSAKRRSKVNAMLEDFRSHRKEAGSKLREQLTQSQSSRKSEVKGLLKSAQKMISDLGKSRQESGKKLRKVLTRGRTDRGSAVKEMRSVFHKSQAAVRADIGEARDAWQELNRGVKKVKVEATPEVIKAEMTETMPVEAEIPDLEAKLLAAINDHPEGITLTEVAESLGVAPVVFGRAAKKLVDEEKVRKEDKTYFPIE